MTGKSTLKSLTEELSTTFPKASCFQFMNVAADKQPNVPEVAAEEEVSSLNLPLPLPAYASHFSSGEDFLKELPIYSTDMTSLIEQMTRGQAENSDWHLYRLGRITGSTAHAVMTRGKKLAASDGAGPSTTAPSNLANKILGRQVVSSSIPALKYGREMEGEARAAYIKSQRTQHRKLTVTEGGLFVSETTIFLGASPDGVVSCQCCGEGVLEIKCPFSASHTIPSPENVAFLEASADGTIGLKRSHQYFSQIQFQMGVMKRKWCDFFVYTRHGQHNIRVQFNQDRWDELLLHSRAFFIREIADELVSAAST